MKKVLILLPMMLLLLNSFAQTVVNPYPKTITVNGTAEMEIVPDEIYVRVDLKEYDKKGQGKINIDKIKNDFLSNVRNVGIADSLVSIAAYNGNPWMRKKIKKGELYASISYLLKLKNSTQLDNLVNKLDDEATSNFYIERTSHSHLNDFRKQLKIQAVKAAKEKAKYLTEAVNETIGEAVTINEPVEYYVPYYNMNQAANIMLKERVMDAASADGNSEVDFRKIKLKYDVSVVYALK